MAEDMAKRGEFCRSASLRFRFLLLLTAALFSPGSYDRFTRARLATAICHAAGGPLAPWLAASFLLAYALTQLIAAAAEQYALSHLALETVVRVYVVELLPLAAAVFVALRSGATTIDRWAHWRMNHPDRWPAWSWLVPEALANAFAVAFLALASAAVSMLAAYLVIHGATPWAFAGFTRLVGQLFDPLSAAAVLARLFLFAVALGVAPFFVLFASARRSVSHAVLHALAGLLAVLAAVELAFLFFVRRT